MKQFLASIFLLVSIINAQVTGLSGWDLFVDPGHSQIENMGVSGYSEAESNLTMALHLKEILLSETDIAEVWTSRSNHTELVSLNARSDMANLLGAQWFHAIHSNAPASTPAGNNVLLLYGESSPGVEKTWAPGGRAVSDIMAPVMAATMRIPEFGGNGSRGDCVFYGATSGPYLSVNRRTNMPSELSESGFHTIPSHNQLQMNPEYARLVAYSMFWTFLDHHNIERPNAGILTGIIADSESGIRINGATASVDGQVYTTDSYDSRFHLYTTNPNLYHNGFYFFEGISPGTHEIIVSAPGFRPDTLNVTMDENFITFRDIGLTSTTPPVVLASSPALNDTLFPSWDELVFQFSRAMNRLSVEAAFSITPSHTGAFSWSADSKTMTFLPDDVLAYVTTHTLEIAGSAFDVLGYPLDGNGDGVGGDSWTIQFTTGYADMDPPAIIQSYPINGQGQIGLKPVLSIVYDELIEPSSFQEDMIIFKRWAGSLDVSRIVELDVVGDHSVIHVYTTEFLTPLNSYILKVLPGLADGLGHTVSSTKTINFSTTGVAQQTVTIDDFDGNFTSYWWRPNNGVSDSTTGVIDENTNYWENSDLFVRNSGSSQSMQLDYDWNPDVSTWLIRLYLSGGAPRGVQFNDSYKLQAFVFGDGQGNKMRFAVHDATYFEVSPWYTIDWYGWRLVSWDMSNDGTGTWIGDGVLDGSLYIDSFQFTHDEGAGMAGTYYIDDLCYAEAAPTSTEPDPQGLPLKFALLPNYPNPFNPWTNIPFTLPERADVHVSVYNLRGEEVAHLISGSLDAGYHVTRWNASEMSSGLYLIKLEANDILITRKVTVLK